ncbi:acyltransferase domain-containing protein, partial [Streptomyces sp. NPDC059233]
HDTPLHRTEFTQPALFALETALYRLLESWGITPGLVAGHSIGSVAAAHVAGVLTLPDAATLIAARGRLMQALPSGGAMVALSLDEESARALLTGHEAAAGVAAVNGPRATVVSGSGEAVREIAARAAEAGAKTRRLTVSHAFHSPLMEPMLESFREVVAGLAFQAPVIPLVSDLTGRLASAEELASPDYWTRHVRETVRFADALRTLRAEGAGVFLELGPDAVLSTMAADTLPDAVLLPLLRRDRAEGSALPEALGGLWAAGVPVDWAAYFGGRGTDTAVPALPTYPFRKDRYWLDVPGGNRTDVGGAGLGAADHPLLGAAVELADGSGVVHTGRISLRTHPWLADHALLGTAVVPGAALLDLALYAGRTSGSPRVAELTLTAPLPVPEEGAVQIQLTVGAAGDGGRRPVTLHAREAGTQDAWTEHASGLLAPEADGESG